MLASKKYFLLFLLLFAVICGNTQTPGDTTFYTSNDTLISVVWSLGNGNAASMTLDLDNKRPLFKSIELSGKGYKKTIAEKLDPSFILTVGKRDLISQNGWNIFFDKVPNKPHQSYTIDFKKRTAYVTSSGSRITVHMDGLHAASFSGALEITCYIGSPLFNVAAVMSTSVDSTAILYDAGLLSKGALWNKVSWSDVENNLQHAIPNSVDSSKNIAVKYRSIIGENTNGSLAVFPAPHQYFYPLDEAFNLRFTWYGNNYRDMLPGFGLGIRQDLQGDRRFVPWFNSPPGTNQRLNFFCLLNPGKASDALVEVKKFTHNDSYVALPGYKTMSSHYHNEFIMKVVRAGKPIPDYPEFKDVFKKTGIDIVHLGEFHYTAHPKGPDSLRLAELKDLFELCKRLSDKNFLLLPGEEPNEFFGGHWMGFFPKPVYWIMARKTDQPFVTKDPKYGTVYRIGNKDEMLKLLEMEKGLAWTAHARTKGSTGYPDKYKEEAFFNSPQFMGAAWKAMPADLSLPSLGRRVLDLMDDMNNWGLKKSVIGEADVFTITHENEMYAHLNVNYLQIASMPDYNKGWQPVLTAMQKGKFFTSTGEVLLPAFSVNGKGAGETATLDASGKVTVAATINWTFPLNYAEIVSGDGVKVYKEKIDLNDTRAFGKKQFAFKTNLKNRKWVRLEVWDIAANGAFTQTVWLK